MGKGEIARYEEFLLFPLFSKGLFPRGVKRCHCVGMGKSFPKQQILDSSKLEEFADDSIQFDENGRKNSTNGGQKEKFLVTGNFPFFLVISKDFYCRHIKIRAC